MTSELSTTSYALLGLLVFDDATSSTGLTGYEVKQRADVTLRFYWTSPAMSQIYTEMSRLHRQGLVESVVERPGRRTTRRYRITPSGQTALTSWLSSTQVDFPILKHPVALRLLMGHLMTPDHVEKLLGGYREALVDRRAELQDVRDLLGDNPDVKFPALVADWGLAYYAAEDKIVTKLIAGLGP